MTKEQESRRIGLRNLTWLQERELGFKKRLGFGDAFSNKLYSSLRTHDYWDQFQHTSNKIHGGVFNLEFSPDGSLLVAACEKKSIIMFDPLNKKVITSVDYAHGDCVNCVRFLDNRTFATCSDDSTVALWDARNLKSKTRVLQGHSNWVKNIEYSAKDDLLVTSGFDGSIYTWDINCYNEASLTHKRVFHTNGLMRTRLSPNANKMVICTTGGYLIIIHDLNLKTLAKDLLGFKPNMYRLMQLSAQTIPVANAFSHLFSPKRTTNRIEFITDFPPGDEAEVVSALQIHPQGWCCLSRNINNEESSEWTCVHDIQKKTAEEMDNFQILAETEQIEHLQEVINQNDLETEIEHDPAIETAPPIVNLVTSRRMAMRNAASSFNQSSSSASTSSATTSNFESLTTFNPPSSPSTRRQFRHSNPEIMTSTDVWEALIAIREARFRRELINRNPEGQFNFNNMQRISSARTGILGQNRVIDENDSGSDSVSDDVDLPAPSCQTSGQPRRKGTKMIYKNMPRLTHFIEEPNKGKGFIKEQCFSPDGRIICSPFVNGVRLLAFSPDCREMSTCLPHDGPARLVELSTNMCHSDIVVSSKFSPKHTLLVTGCLGGKIMWHRPVM